jgi:hypothetical protein
VKTIFEKQFFPFCASKGFHFLMQVVDVSVMRDFRTTWKDGAMSRSKKQDRIVGSFFFCERSGWIQRNPSGPDQSRSEADRLFSTGGIRRDD